MLNLRTGINFKKSYQNGRWITADLHIHSIYSDGGFTPGQILKYAAHHFLDVVAIADHSATEGGLEAKSLGKGKPELPLAIMAQEVSAGDRFHFLLLNCGEPQSDFNRDNLGDRLAEHRRQGGVTVLAHPWTMPKAKWARSCLRDLIAADLIDGFELFNSASLNIPDISEVWRRLWEEWIAPYKLGVFGGSDFHHLRKGRYIGTGRTYLKVFAPGEAGIIDALRARRCVAGLFGHQRPAELQSDAGLIWGREPWLSELQWLRDSLQQKMTELNRFAPAYRKLFVNLFEAGHYQLLADLF
ncbi:MAG: CehA/McbA family metallohydrolase [Firmicutes bacterium]|nr:CehA/McbA family metallohydrolase [Bacillota bacterium]